MRNDQHPYQAFYQTLKEDRLPGLLFLCGQERYLVKWASDRIRQKYVAAGAEAVDCLLVDGDEEIDLAGIQEACETFPVFSPKRMVELRLPSSAEGQVGKGMTAQGKKDLATYLSTLSDRTIFLITGTSMGKTDPLLSVCKKNGAVFSFDKIERKDLAAFASKRFRDAGKKMSPRVLALLLEETGYFNKESCYDLFAFENDIKKMIAYSDGEEIGEEAVQACVIRDEDTFVFHLLDAVGSGNIGDALVLLDNMRGEGDSYRLLPLLISQFELMLSVKQLTEKGFSPVDAAAQIGASPYRVRKMLSPLRRFSEKDLRSLLSHAYECDRALKTGLMTADLALELLFAETKKEEARA